MRLAIIAAAFVALVGLPGLTGIELTKSGPDRPAPTLFEHGGGGGP